MVDSRAVVLFSGRTRSFGELDEARKLAYARVTASELTADGAAM